MITLFKKQGILELIIPTKIQWTQKTNAKNFGNQNHTTIEHIRDMQISF